MTTHDQNWQALRFAVDLIDNTLPEWDLLEIKPEDAARHKATLVAMQDVELASKPLVWEKPPLIFTEDELDTIKDYIGYHRDVLSGRAAREAEGYTAPIEEKIRKHLGE